MVSLLSKLLIKDYNNYSDAVVRRKYGILASIIGIFLNILLFGFKYFAGWISASVAIMADAFNNLSDAGSSIITLAGFKVTGMSRTQNILLGMAGLSIYQVLLYLWQLF